jgi:hypothetical protein
MGEVIIDLVMRILAPLSRAGLFFGVERRLNG